MYRSVLRLVEKLVQANQWNSKIENFKINYHCSLNIEFYSSTNYLEVRSNGIVTPREKAIKKAQSTRQQHYI